MKTMDEARKLLFPQGQSYEECLETYMSFQALALEEIRQRIQEDMMAPEFRSSRVHLEYQDEKTGVFMAHDLPLAVQESHLALKIEGEDLGGRPVSIVFLSQRANDKIVDVTGGGPDHDSCGNH